MAGIAGFSVALSTLAVEAGTWPCVAGVVLGVPIISRWMSEYIAYM